MKIYNKVFDHLNKFLTILKYFVELDFEFNITADSCLNSNWYAVDFCSLNSWQYKHKHPTGPSFSVFVFLHNSVSCTLNNGHKKRLKYLLMIFDFMQSLLSSRSLERMCTKVKTCNQVQYLTPEYIRACDALDNICSNYQFNFLIISNINQTNQESFYRLLYSGWTRGWGSCKKGPSTSFSPVTSTNVGISPKNSLTFSFSLIATIVILV